MTAGDLQISTLSAVIDRRYAATVKSGVQNTFFRSPLVERESAHSDEKVQTPNCCRNKIGHKLNNEGSSVKVMLKTGNAATVSLAALRQQ
jgi:hypothetical protein